MFAISAPFTEHMFAPARLRDKCRPAPQLHPKYSRGTGIRGLGYQDHFPWLRKNILAVKYATKKRPAFHLVVVLSFSTTTKYKEIAVLIRPYSVSTFPPGQGLMAQALNRWKDAYSASVASASSFDAPATSLPKSVIV